MNPPSHFQLEIARDSKKERERGRETERERGREREHELTGETKLVSVVYLFIYTY